MRYSTAVQRAGLFKDEPDVVRAFLHADVPLPLAMRSFDAYASAKQQSVNQMVADAGFSQKSQEQNILTQEKVDQAVNDKLNAVSNPGGFWGTLGKAGQAIGNAFTTAGSKIMEGASDVWHAVTLPLTAGYASDNAFDTFTNMIGSVPGQSPMVGAGVALASGIENYGEGAYRLASGDVSEQQKQDITRGGGDPNSFGSRVAYYYQDYGEKKTPVSDADVNWLKNLNKYDPADVDAAREIVTSGALDNLTKSMPHLSERAQSIIYRSSTDKNVGELLSAMADSSQTSFGGRLVRQGAPDAAPGETFGPGTASRAIVGAIAETIATWHLDPGVLAAKGIGAFNNARWAVGLTDADSIDRTVQMLKASDAEFAPHGAPAKRFDQAMGLADQMVTAGLETPEAAKVRQGFLRAYPGYDKTLDLLVGMRNGSVGSLRIRDTSEALKDATAAAEAGRNVKPWVIDAPGDGKPFWSFTKADGSKASAEERALEREKVAKELSTFIITDAYASGREINGSRLLLPGQMSVSGKIRNAIAPVVEAFTRRDASVMKQIKDVGKAPIPLNGHLAADEAGRWDQLVSPESSEWYRNNYTFGITHALSRGWRNFEKTFSNAVINPASPDSVSTFQRLVSQFMPKRQAQMMATQYAGANPAERWTMVRQTLGSLLNTMNLRNTPAAQGIVERLSKGLVPTDNAINGYKAGGLEWYTTPDKNFIRVGDFKMPAAVHPWQVAEGIQLPNLRELRSLANRNWMVNAVTRTTDSDTVNSLVRTWKASKVTTWANMARQALEGFAFTAWRDPAAYAELRGARQAVKSAVITGRADVNDIKRLAAQTNNFTSKDLADLEKVRRTDPEQFVTTLQGLLTKNGFDPGASEVLARMGSDVDVAEFWGSLNIKGGIKTGWLGAMGPWDALRRFRAARLEKKGGTILDSPLERHLDNDLMHQIMQAHARQLGNASDSYAWNTAERAHNVNRQIVIDGAGKGIAMRPVKVDNAYDWLGSKGDVSANLWAAELGRRLNDKTGQLAARLIAHQHITGTHGAITQPVMDMMDELGAFPERLTHPDNLMAYLYGEHELGAGMRTNSARMQYLPDGTPAVSEADRLVAVEHAARAAVDDLVHHLGGQVSRPEGVAPRITFPDEMEPILAKVARGDSVSADDLAKLPAEVRPEGMVTPVYAPMVGSGPGRMQKLANLAARAYGAVVAQPMENMYLLPAYIAHKRLAYGEAAPLMEELVSRGMSPGQAAYATEAMVSNRAIARVFKTSDNPSERTVFSEMGDKWLMFQRANEDFLRRLLHATAASPEGVARANILVQAGVHSGILHAEPVPDENGNTEQRLTFTYPGSALAQRVLADAGTVLGLFPDEFTRVPQFDGLKSQVRFINPGISNPISFSANPIFGYAVSGMEKLWPSATVDLERIKRAFSGGQDFEGTEGPFSLKNLMPSMFSRFVPLMQQDDADGQFQSAMRSAMMYAEVNGSAPNAGASPAERARFLDNIKATATNILIERALFGSFLPATPQLADPQNVEEDVLGRIQGLPNLRSEFFQIRSELSQKFPDNFSRANSEAVAEFARRYPGELIVNPASFSIGSTTVAGADKEFVPYTIEATRWLFANMDFVKSNPTVALALMPKSTTDGDFSNEAYKLQLKSDVRTHKDLNQFYSDLTLSDDIGEYYKTRSNYFAAMNQNPEVKKSISTKLDEWDDGWRRTHPLAAQELDRRADPNFTHAEIAPAIERILNGTDPLPASMDGVRPQLQEMYNDYSEYRKRYMAASYYNNAGRSAANKEYQRQGDLKWLGAPLSGLSSQDANAVKMHGGQLADLWDLMRVTEGR